MKRIKNTYSIRGYCRRTPFSCVGLTEFLANRKKSGRSSRETLPQIWLHAGGNDAMHVRKSLYRRVYRRFYTVSRDLPRTDVVTPSRRGIFFNCVWKLGRRYEDKLRGSKNFQRLFAMINWTRVRGVWWDVSKLKVDDFAVSKKWVFRHVISE